ncbi:acyltransferase family protein [Variovorax sp. J22G21]|nr:acyltransferase family protein [Variovorax sp. J22G21]
MTTPMAPAADQQHLIHPKYRPDIDGLRAVAVLSVLGFHAFPQWVKGGFIGVDIFFVISGFLISTIIFASLEGKGFSYGEFYARRIKRIFPALWLVMGATFAFGWYTLLPNEWKQLGKHMAAGAGFVSNFAFWGEAGYFDNAAETKPLLHLWSLAIEEQFYIFWPLLLGLAWRRKWRVLAVVGGVVAASFLLNVGTIHSHRTAAFYSPLSRFWELMAGGMLAYMRLHKPHMLVKHRNVQAIAGFVLLALGLVLLRSSKAFPGWWALLPVLGTFYCISAGPQAWLNRHVLGSKPLVWVGLISYPLYLWHWPLLAFARIFEGKTPSDAVRAAAMVAAIVLAWLTWRFVERYTRQTTRRPVMVGLAASLVAFVLLGLLAFTGHLKGRHSDPYFDKTAAAARDWSYPEGLDYRNVYGELVYRLGEEGRRKVLMFGDSHIEQYSPRALELSKTAPDRLQDIYFATWGSCPPIPNVIDGQNSVCAKRRDEIMKFALSNEVDTVVFGACWNCIFITAPVSPGVPNEGADRFYYVDGKTEHRFFGGDGVDYALRMLEFTMKNLATHKKVYLVLDNPVGDNFGPEYLIKGSRLGNLRVDRMSPTAAWPPEQKALHQRMRELAERAGATVIDPVPALCDKNDQCTRAMPDGTPIYKDSGHLRSDWTRRSASYLDAALTEPKK